MLPGSMPPYLFTKGENRIKGSSAVVYILADLKPSFFKIEVGKIISQAYRPDLYK
jgi:hypothetical protein